MKKVLEIGKEYDYIPFVHNIRRFCFDIYGGFMLTGIQSGAHLATSVVDSIEPPFCVQEVHSHDANPVSRKPAHRRIKKALVVTLAKAVHQSAAPTRNTGREQIQDKSVV